MLIFILGGQSKEGEVITQVCPAGGKESEEQAPGSSLQNAPPSPPSRPHRAKVSCSAATLQGDCLLISFLFSSKMLEEQTGQEAFKL